MDRTYTLFAVGNAVIALSKAERVAAYDDLINSNLLAQLVANKKIENKTVENWYDAYMAVMDDFWMRSLKFRQDLRPEAGRTASPLEWAVAVMENNGAREEDQTVDGFLAYVARLPCSVLRVGSLPDIVQEPCEDDVTETPAPLKAVRLLAILAQGPSSITSVYLDFQTRQALTPNPWSQRFKAEDVHGLVCVRYARANLSETLYALSSDAIALKVRDRLTDNVSMLVESADMSPGYGLLDD